MPTITLTANDDVLNQQGLSNDGLIDTIYGLAGADSILGDGQDRNDLEGDLIYGGEGADTLGGAFGANTIYGEQGDDLLDNRTVIASDGIDTVYGGIGNDSIFGKRGDDLIYGGEGADTINSNLAILTGNTGLDVQGDTVYGGDGDDVITTQDNTNPAISSSIGDLVYGGDGNDSILGAFENPAGDPENPTPGIDTGLDDDIIYGGRGADTIDGNGGTDFIYAGEGDDLVLAADDDDTTDGGAGIDTIDFTNDSGRVEFDMASGVTTVIRTTGADLTDNELNTNYENAIGTAGNDTINGNDAANSIAGGAGVDLLTGGLNSDTFVSGAGDDSINGDEDADNSDVDVLDYSAETAGVVVTYTGDEAGTAQGVSTGQDTFENIERVIFTGQDDAVDGSADNAGITLDTGAGNDFVEAGQAADSLDGGDGIDTLSYVDSPDGVTLDLEAGTGSGGNADGDTFQNFENVQLTAADDNVATSSGNDTIDAGDGNDNVGGSAGADSLDGGDGDGDTLDYSASAAPVTIDLEAQTVSGGDAEGDTIANFEGATGSAGDDSITGNDDDNDIDGGDGNDNIDAGGGNDTVDGGDGDDTIDGGDGDDSITGGDGADSITTGAGGDNVDAGDGNDFIVGDSGDIIDGGGDSVNVDPNNPTPGDFDTLSVPVPDGGSFVVNADPTNPEQGTVDIFDGPNGTGNLVGTINFTEIENIVCFTRGTMIETPSGEVAIENLSEGDLVMTRDHGAQPLRWIGSKALPASGKLAPVMIKAGALGNDRDLMVSQLHRMLVTDWRAELMFGEAEVLATAKHLVNGDSIYVAEGGEVEYFHMLFDNHEIVTANGAASESFHPGEQGMGWLEQEMREEIFTIFPELRVELDGYGPSARMSLKGFEARALKR